MVRERSGVSSSIQVRSANAQAAAIAFSRKVPPSPSIRRPAASPIQRMERRNCGPEAAIANGSRAEARKIAVTAAR